MVKREGDTDTEEEKMGELVSCTLTLKKIEGVLEELIVRVGERERVTEVEGEFCEEGERETVYVFVWVSMVDVDGE